MRAIVKADPKTGNDPLEASASFMVCPREGECIEVVIRDDAKVGGDERQWLDVDRVIHVGPESEVEVWVTFDEYDLRRLEAAIAAVGEQFTSPF